MNDKNSANESHHEDDSQAGCQASDRKKDKKLDNPEEPVESMLSPEHRLFLEQFKAMLHNK